MAHGFVSYSQPKGDLNLPALIAGKIKNAYSMSAEERKARDEEIKKLTAKEELTEEESQRLEFLENQSKERKEGGIKKSFFAKALMSEFGGDRRRRLAGTFSKDPDATRDPSLTKEQRFSALLDGVQPAEEPAAPVPYDDSGEYGAPEGAAPPQQSTLQKILSMVSSSYDMIANRVSALGTEEKNSVKKKEETNSKLSKFATVFDSIKNYFNKDNELKEVENEHEKQKIEQFVEAQADAKAQAELNDIKSTEKLTGQEDDLGRPDEKTGGLLGNLIGGFQNIMKLFGGKGKTPGVTPQTNAYSSPIGPQPMNSPTPWAAKGPGDMGGMFGQGGFTPRLPATKLSSGGIVPGKSKKSPEIKASSGVYNNPTTTTLNPGDAVVPLNRNNALASVFKQAGQGSAGKDITDPMSKVIQLPTQVGGGLLFGLLNQAMSAFGGVANIFKPIISSIATPLASAFGLPATIIGSLFGGPAAAATMDFDPLKFFGKGSGEGKKGGAGAPPPPPPGGGAAADLAGTSVVNEVTASGLVAAAGTAGAHKDVGVTSTFGGRSSPGGIGSTNHQGVDIGTSGQKGYKVAFQRSGTVTHAGTMGGYGNLVIIKDSAGTEYYFGHLANINPEIKVGAKYTGQTIGEIGNTGTSTGEHLHFEKHPNGGAAIDPMPDIGLLSIGKSTKALGSADAPVITMPGLNKPEKPATQVSPGLEKAAPALASIIKQNQKQQVPDTSSPVTTRNAFSLNDPSGSSLLFQNAW